MSLARVRCRLSRPLVAVVAALAFAVPATAADDVVAEEAPPQAPPARPQPMVRLMPPGIRVEIEQLEVVNEPEQDGEGVRREAYLGVVTGPVSEQLRAQLEMPEGVGLVVEAVAKDGPAGRGGIEKFDVLQKFNDQLICTSEQLSTLVKAAGKGKEATLTVIRGGKERQLDVLIDEREVVVGGPAAAPAGPFGRLPGEPMELEGLFDQILPEMPGFGGDIRGQVQRQVQEALEQAQAGGFGGNGAARVLQIYPGGMSQNMVVVADERGTVEIREADGKRTVTVKDPGGKQVHQGPLDTEADREKVPEAFRGMVEEVEGRLGGRARPRAGDDLSDNEL